MPGLEEPITAKRHDAEPAAVGQGRGADGIAHKHSLLPGYERVEEGDSSLEVMPCREFAEGLGGPRCGSRSLSELS